MQILPFRFIATLSVLSRASKSQFVWFLLLAHCLLAIPGAALAARAYSYWLPTGTQPTALTTTAVMAAFSVAHLSVTLLALVIDIFANWPGFGALWQVSQLSNSISRISRKQRYANSLSEHLQDTQNSLIDVWSLPTVPSKVQSLQRTFSRWHRNLQGDKNVRLADLQEMLQLINETVSA